MRSPEQAVEEVWGPVNGLYIAAYAAPVDDDPRRFAAYAKVCWRAPDGYWGAECLFKLFGGEHHGNAQNALAQVRRVAYGKVACIPRSAVSMLDIAARQDGGQRLLVPLASAIRWRVLRGA